VVTTDVDRAVRGEAVITQPSKEDMMSNTGVKSVVYPVRDLAAAKALFTMVAGVPPEFDESYYVGWRLGGQDIGLDPHGHRKGMSGPVPYWHVDDIEKSLRALVDAGAEQLQEPKNVGGGMLIASVKDSDGNVIGLVQAP
jgi:predicted enzyme related to lactoylglutathione lyase